MFKRIFFAVNLPENVKEELFSYQEETKRSLDRGVRWVEKENLHITLLFLGSVKKEKLESVIAETRKITEEPIDVSLKKISYIPPQKRNAKMIWAVGESRGLVNLEKRIFKNILTIKNLTKDHDFVPHVTLGRINLWDFRRIPMVQIPEINTDLEINFKIHRFQLMESKTLRTGPVYKTIEEFNLDKDK